MKTIAVDFDGVIHKYSRGWQGGEIYDVPVEGAMDGIEKLMAEGYNIVIHTTRENHDDVRTWLRKHWYKNWVDVIEITSTKPKAIAYIDDRALRFTTWEDVRKYFS